MVGLLDVFDQLIQTPLKLIKKQRTRKREKGRKYGRKKVYRAEKIKGDVEGQGSRD